VEVSYTGGGVFPDIESAVTAADKAFCALDALPLAQRKDLIRAMRRVTREEAERVSRFVCEETGLGRLEDKILKHHLAADKTPGVEIIEPTAYSGDNGLTIMEPAPYGVIGAITPVTNPTATIICNSIGMVAAGNAVVFNPHPSAKKSSVLIIRLLNEAIVDAGGPPDLLCTVENPTIASAQELMKHPGIRLLVVTGGPAVVKVAMQSGKKVIAAGPGNPPAVVDETADIPRAARDIVTGASFENNIVCILEKEIIAVDSIVDQLKEEMKRNRAVELNHHQARRLEKVILQENRGPGKESLINKKWVGKNASLIAGEIDLKVPEDTRLLFTETDADHPFVWTELLMPVIALVKVANADEAIDLAKRVEQGNGHTATMHSRNIDALSKMARTINTSIFVKNGPTLAGLGVGGEGYTSFSIASPTGDGLTTARTFTRQRRCTLVDSFRII
jgi:acyl-CoA reductase-like NAD-dependent aldehyde dehydrogenase